MNATQNPATGVDSPADILRRAALYLTRRGWVQGVIYDLDSNTPLPRACALGAINAVVTGDPAGADDPVSTAMAAIRAAQRQFANYLVAGIDYDFFRPRDIIADFNDTKGRTVDEVVTELTNAADDYDNRQHTAGDK